MLDFSDLLAVHLNKVKFPFLPGVVGPDAEVPELEGARVLVEGAEEGDGVLGGVATLVLVAAEHADLHHPAVGVAVREVS